MPENKETLIQSAESVLYKTYNRFPVVFDHGQGVWLYDTDGAEYLDFGAGIAVAGLGYGDTQFTGALQEQASKLLHTSNLFYNAPAVRAGEKLLAASGMEKVFFTNSGTEAIEGALKIARRHAYNRNPGGEHTIIAMNGSFHGRSLGALSVTGNEHYRAPFAPLIPGVRFADFNDLDSVRRQLDSTTCAVILEPIQGEGGIYPAHPDFLSGVRQLCDEHGVLLIFDEIQCGMGRTGSMFAWQAYGVRPDVLTVAKALGNGVPIGAFLACGQAASAMVPGDHGSTYGGNPFAAAAAETVLDIFRDRDIPAHAAKMGAYLGARLQELTEQFPCVAEQRGMGLMQGLQFNIPIAPIVQNALLEQNLILISAANNTIRFVPPLVIETQHIDEMISRLKKAISAVTGTLESAPSPWNA